MGHCVGQYANRVKNGDIRVFSLRDPKNEPHITLGMYGGDDNRVFQYYGTGNSDPKPLYQEMIKEWFLSIGNVENDSNIDSAYDEDDLEDVENTEEILNNRINHFGEKHDSYGFLAYQPDYPISLSEVNSMLEKYKLGGENVYNRHVVSDLHSIADLLLQLHYLYSLEQFKLYKKGKSNNKKLENKTIYGFMQDCYESVNEASEKFWEYYDPYYDESDMVDMNEEEKENYKERIYQSEEKEFMSEWADSLLANIIIEKFDKNQEYKNIYNEIYQILKSAKHPRIS